MRSDLFGWLDGGVEVVEQPQGLESQFLTQIGQLDCSPPGADRIPTLLLPDPSLREVDLPS